MKGIILMAVRNEQRTRTRQDLVDAFWNLYRTKRLERISVREIAEKAGFYSLEFILSALIGILSYWIQQDESVPPERLAGWIYDHLENGFMNKLQAVH